MKGNSGELKLLPMARMIRKRSTKPANTVRPKEVKIDAMKKSPMSNNGLTINDSCEFV
jgi:hypothetical protein